MLEKPIRYAVVGLGYISQIAVLPAFDNARENSRLTALISNDPVKRAQLGSKYGVRRTYSYEQLEECARSGEVDAIYLAVPNNLHREFTVRAARAGLHVLCEKPMAVTEQECEEMIRAADENSVKLMIAYRLHFEAANLNSIEVVQSGRLGEPRFFSSVFGLQVQPGNIRLERELGGGPLYDIGIYCINAARYLFRAEPIEVSAWFATRPDGRFREVDEMAVVMLRFPEDRLASFTCSFGATSVSAYRVVGTTGHLRLEPAYGFAEDIRQEVTVEGKPESRDFPKRDQFAPLLVQFSSCILENREVEPGGREGLADVRVIRALYESAASGGRPVKLPPLEQRRRPSVAQEIHKPGFEAPELVRAQGPSQAA